MRPAENAPRAYHSPPESRPVDNAPRWTEASGGPRASRHHRAGSGAPLTCQVGPLLAVTLRLTPPSPRSDTPRLTLRVHEANSAHSSLTCIDHALCAPHAPRFAILFNTRKANEEAKTTTRGGSTSKHRDDRPQKEGTEHRILSGRQDLDFLCQDSHRRRA